MGQALTMIMLLFNKSFFPRFFLRPDSNMDLGSPPRHKGRPRYEGNEFILQPMILAKWSKDM